MAFSGGTFSRTFDCTTDRDNGVKILASKFDTELDGMATGLSTCILKDGTQTCTAAIPFAQGITLPDDKTIAFGTNSDVLIQYDETTTDSLKISAAEGAGLAITLMADEGDDAGDEWKLNIADGGTLTLGNDINSAGTYVTHLTITPNATVANSTMAVAGNLTVGGALTLGSGAVISEAELETIDGITPGTVLASKAMVVDSDKDITGGRNLTITGELDAATLDISGNADIDGTLEADAMTLNGTAITATATLDTGISNNNVPKFTSGAADNDFLRIDGTAIEGRSAAEVLSDIGAQASLTFGISNTNAVKIDSSSVADDEYARFTANGLESRATAEVLSDIAAAPAAGSSNIVTTGALNSGSITSGFGAIDNGSSAITTTGVITGGTLEATADTSAGDNAAIGYTSAEGLILTGQGSTSDITLKNDADATVFTVPTGTDDILFPDGAKAMFGASSDLQIYHDGSNSYVQENGTGTLNIQGTNLALSSSTGEYYLFGSADNATTLYHNNAAKLATTSTGVDVTGTVTATTVQANAGGTFTTASGNDLNIVYPAGRSLFIKEGTENHLTIDNNGALLVNTTSRTGTSNLVVEADTSVENPMSVVNSRSSASTDYHIIMYRAGNIVGSIQTTLSATSFVTSSDYRLKENVSYTWDATTRLKQLKPARFNFIAEADTTVDGFLAHEVQTIVPEAVSGTKDATEKYTDIDGKEQTRIVPQGLDQAKFVPLLVKTIQELEARITALEAG